MIIVSDPRWGRSGFVARASRGAPHHGEHLAAAGAHEALHQNRGEQQEGDVQEGGVVAADPVLADVGVPRPGGDQPERGEDQLDEVAAATMVAPTPSAGATRRRDGLSRGRTRRSGHNV